MPFNQRNERKQRPKTRSNRHKLPHERPTSKTSRTSMLPANRHREVKLKVTDQRLNRQYHAGHPKRARLPRVQSKFVDPIHSKISRNREKAKFRHPDNTSKMAAEWSKNLRQTK